MVGAHHINVNMNMLEKMERNLGKYQLQNYEK